MAESNSSIIPDTSSSPAGLPRKHTNGAPGVRIRPRRVSSGLGGEPPGDTAAAALATLSPTFMAETPVARSSLDRFPRQSRRRRARSLFRRWLRFSLRHTWVNPLAIILLVLSLYLMRPGATNPLHAAIFLSYPVPGTSPRHYAKGRADVAFVTFYTVVFSFTREFLMQQLLRPLAIRFGLRTRARQSRFMEQFYAAMYFGIFGPLGLYVMKQTPVWYFNTRGMYEGSPHKTHTALFKAYYLLQASYWAQQGLVLVLMLEKPRKDFKEFVLHHIVTLSLIWSSYSFHFTYMGIAVYITHDISDFFLASSKVLNYIDAPFTGSYFALFVASWIYLRHYLNLKLLYSILTDFKTVGPFGLDWVGGQYKCQLAQFISFSLLGTLQAVNMFWLFLILRILYRYVFRSHLGDDRSDDDDDEVEDKDEGSALATGETAASDKSGLVGGQWVSPTVLLNGKPVEDDVSQKREYKKSR